MRARLRASSLSPRLAALLTSSTAVAVGKTAVTQLVYETTSNALYLALQSAMRGGGLRGVVAELKQKLLGVWLDGLRATEAWQQWMLDAGPPRLARFRLLNLHFLLASPASPG